jgi:hypothetical protein
MAQRISAPKARNVIAWGNAPGKSRISKKALKARNDSYESYPTQKNGFASQFSAFSAQKFFSNNPDLGRCPRLLHFAPLALIHPRPLVLIRLYTSPLIIREPDSL